jgi:hypothetical protein
MSNAQPASKAIDDVLEPFHLLGLAPRFALDCEVLNAKRLALECQHHPDRFIGDAAKQQEAETLFARLTWAAEQLKSPHTRAKLLFQAHGLWPAPHDSSVLIELMEMQEGVAEGQISRETLEEKKRAAEETLATQLDTQNFQAAGTTFMLWNGLTRLLNPALVPQQPGPLT